MLFISKRECIKYRSDPIPFSEEHIPEDADLVLLELGINDLLEFDVFSQYEHLVRGLLELENKPALINIECVLYHCIQPHCCC